VNCSGESRDTLPAESFVMTGVGDMVFSGDHALNTRSVQAMVSHLTGAALGLSQPAFLFGNLEGPITDLTETSKPSIPGVSYVFRFPVATAKLLKSSGFHAVTLANNHSLDFGSAGLTDTLNHLTQQGIVGSGHHRGKFELFAFDAIKIGLVSVGFYSMQNDIKELDVMAELIASAKRAADVVIVAMHAGAEGEAHIELPDGAETFLGEARGDSRAFARIAIAAGADAIIGYGPHVLRAAECIAGRPVFYSIGNFLGIGGLSTQGLTGVAAIAQLAFDTNKRLIGSRLVPIRFDSNKFPQIDPTGKAIALVRHLNLLAKQKFKDFVPAQLAWGALSETDY
jgi:poly-gamma-glutamate capsule biosynthesis protein CapA/YwtB (metallophosphatase superfamily)